MRMLFTLIVLFWLTSVLWLGYTVWSPQGFRMQKVDVAEVYDLFFRTNESTNMAVLDHGAWVGQVSASGSSGFDKEVGENRRAASIAGTMKSANSTSEEVQTNPQTKSDSDGQLMDLFLRGMLEFSDDEAMDLKRGEFSLRVSSQKLAVNVSLFGEPLSMRAKAVLGNQVLLDYDGTDEAKQDGDSYLSKLPFGGTTTGMIPFSSLTADSATDLSDWNVEVEAWQGKHHIGGRDTPVYLLVISMLDYEQELKIYFSEVGEPLKLETSFGYELVSEVLAPLDAYQKSF